MKTIVTASIDLETYNLAKNHNISWSKALEFGIKFLVAEKESFGYPPNKLLANIENLQNLLAEQVIKNEQENQEPKKEDDNKENNKELTDKEDIDKFFQEQMEAKIDG